MKKFIYTSAVAALVLCAPACHMLDEVNYGNPTVEDMMTNETNVVMQVGQIYANLKYTHDHWG